MIEQNNNHDQIELDGLDIYKKSTYTYRTSSESEKELRHCMEYANEKTATGAIRTAVKNYSSMQHEIQRLKMELGDMENDFDRVKALINEQRYIEKELKQLTK